jgi:MFS family permease
MLTRDSTLLLIALLAYMVVAGLLGGIAGLPFVEITGKTVSPRRRGQLFSLRQTIGSIFAVFGTQVVIFFTGLDARIDFPTNYGMLFIIAAVLQLIGATAFSLIEEPPAESGIEHPKPSLKLMQHIWRTDNNYRHYVHGRTLLVFSSMANGLVLIYANEELGAVGNGGSLFVDWNSPQARDQFRCRTDQYALREPGAGGDRTGRANARLGPGPAHDADHHPGATC